MTQEFRTYRDVGSKEDSPVLAQVLAQRSRIADRLARIGTVVAVASGKGGVGKSWLTANLCALLGARGLRVGALDADLNGPSLARMLGVSGAPMEEDDDGVKPAIGVAGVRVMSMDLLQGGQDSPLRWRGPNGHRFVWQSSIETGAVREFLSDVSWGDLDCLLIDVPPGTDKIARLLELIPDLSIALMVTTPSDIARFVVSKSVRLVREAGVPRVALVANMTEYCCPQCGSRSRLFGDEGDVRELADASGIELWGEIPFDPELGRGTDTNRPLAAGAPESPAAATLRALADRLNDERGAVTSLERRP